MHDCWSKCFQSNVNPWASCPRSTHSVGLSTPAFKDESSANRIRKLKSIRTEALSNEGSVLLTFGPGYTATALANTLTKDKWEVYSTQRRPLKPNGKPFGFHDASEHEDSHFQDLLISSSLLISIPPTAPLPDDGTTDAVLRHYRDDLCARAQDIKWVGYLSTTSVYGDWAGAVVDEESELRARSSKIQARIRAEEEWLDMYARCGLPVHIFRLGGIYGPGRSALEAAKKSAKGDESTSQTRRSQKKYTSRVHVYDVCQAVMKSMANPAPGQVYNLVDDDSASRSEVMKYAGQLLGLPPTTGRVDEPSRAESSLDEKQVSNQKMKQRLGVDLKYPSYREGLAAIHSGDNWPHTDEYVASLSRRHLKQRGKR